MIETLVCPKCGKSTRTNLTLKMSDAKAIICAKCRTRFVLGDGRKLANAPEVEEESAWALEIDGEYATAATSADEMAEYLTDLDASLPPSAQSNSFQEAMDDELRLASLPPNLSPNTFHSASIPRNLRPPPAATSHISKNGEGFSIQPRESKKQQRYVNAGFWRRVRAAIVDWFGCFIAQFVIGFLWGFVIGVWLGANGLSPSQITATFEDWMILFFALGIMVHWLYFTVSESSGWQATFGKRVVGIRVVDEEGRRIGFGRANARYWSKICSYSIFFGGYIMAGFTNKKQGLHDMIAGTLVVNEP